MLSFYPDKTKVIFFDLEYYVPISDRKRKTPSGMKFSPVLKGHKILGGTFLTYFPMQDRVGERCTLWEWGLGSEEKVLQSIFELLEKQWKPVEAKSQAGSLMLSGIGISHSDIPALLSRMSLLDIAPHERLYDVICGCRQIDLATATYCQFSSKHPYFSYPKSKSALYQKYLGGKRIEGGQSVWELYDDSNFHDIELRTKGEVDDALSIYKNMFELKKQNDRAIERTKRIEKANTENDI